MDDLPMAHTLRQATIAFENGEETPPPFHLMITTSRPHPAQGTMAGAAGENFISDEGLLLSAEDEIRLEEITRLDRSQSYQIGEVRGEMRNRLWSLAVHTTSTITISYVSYIPTPCDTWGKKFPFPFNRPSAN